MATPDSGIHPNVPNPARIYDVFLGGKDNFAADRRAAEAIMAAIPESASAAREQRRFIGRAVGHLVDQGIRQFLDIGSGLPTMDNTHEVAQRIEPESRVVYVDNDPIVLNHARALLTGPGSIAVDGDIREPEQILARAEIKEMIDFSEPAGLLMTGLLHFIPDEDDPWDLVERVAGPLAPGSHLVLSHGCGEGMDPEALRTGQEVYRSSSQAIFSRSPEEIARMFTGAGFTLIEPGLVWLPEWRPGPDQATTELPTHLLCGVGRR